MRFPFASSEGRNSRGEALAAVAVEILSRSTSREGQPDLHLMARRAVGLRLAGILRMGWRVTGEQAGLDVATHEMLARAERLEVAADLTHCRRASEALEALRAAGVRPVVMKGRSLAERLWPRPWMRPSGDLDLLLERRSLAPAMAALCRAGYRPQAGAALGRFRPSPWFIEMSSADGSVIDIHWSLFRSVGAGIASREVLARARDAALLGAPVRVLDPADEVLFLLVHAAAHGVVRTKWLLDLHAAALVHGDDVWRVAAERAAAARVARPFWAAARLLSGAHATTPRRLARDARPAAHVRAILRRVVVVEAPEGGPAEARWRSYCLEGLLEENVRLRCVRAIGVLERKLLTRRPARASHSRASARWVAGAWRRGEPRPVRLTLRGGSMAPTLEEGARIVAAPYPPGEGPREGDVVIAERSGRLVAHRIVALLADKAVTRGDASAESDEAIPIAEILARVVAMEP